MVSPEIGSEKPVSLVDFFKKLAEINAGFFVELASTNHATDRPLIEGSVASILDAAYKAGQIQAGTGLLDLVDWDQIGPPATPAE